MSTSDGVVLVVLDGVGIGPSSEWNAFDVADTPVLDELFDTYPYTELVASGPAVGLPDGYAGNSEVGHLHIGAGRVVPQHLTRIDAAIEDGTLFESGAIQETVEYVQETGGTVHLLGIVSNGGVHGHIDHLLALLQYLGEQDVEVVTHAVLDGRDVPPESGERYLTRIEEAAEAVGTGHTGSFMGRFYAMDRDGNWDRTRTAYGLLSSGDGRTVQSVSEGLDVARDTDRNDYFVCPTVIGPYYEPVGEGDVIICTNYRKDRMRQLARAFTDPGFDRFPTESDGARFVSMTPYGESFENQTIMEGVQVERTLGEVVADSGMQQLRATESQKRPHVTYFFDGERETRFPGEERCIVPSADVEAYDERPEMAAEQVTDTVIGRIESGQHRFILVNYPNGDLVGHTGDMSATVEAVETVDAAVGRLMDAALPAGYAVVLTADHGNCEQMQVDGGMCTSHTLNNVPFCIVTPEDIALEQGTAALSRVAPTVLDLLNLDVPDPMEDSLIR